MELGSGGKEFSLAERLLDAFQTIIAYDYDDLNRLTDTSYEDGPTYHYAYDNLGNRNPQLEILNEYNSDGLRVGATVNDVAVHYTYDLNAALPLVLAETMDESVVHSYYGLGLIAQRTRSDWIYLLHDALGSTARRSARPAS